MKLHFDRDLVARLLAHANEASDHTPNYAQMCDRRYRKDGATRKRWPELEDIDTTKIPAGLWLVGDQGVYLMSNGRPNLRRDETSESALVAMAFETDPDRHPDSWYDTKRASFGGDDGCDFISAETIQSAFDATQGCSFWIDVSPDGLSVPVLVSKPRKTPEPGSGNRR